MAENQDILDLFVVGFGPAGVAIAVGINDHPEGKNIKVHYAEKQPTYGWHLGMTIPGYKMQVSFLKDFVTMRDPTSHFSFLNYLKHRGRLAAFSNLYTFLPLREEYNDYMAWVAGHFDNQVNYNCEATSVEPYYLNAEDEKNKITKVLKVNTRNPATGETKSFLTRNIAIATGAQPKLPDIFPKNHPLIRHSSQYLFTKIPEKAKHIGVIGAGQSAAEIFKHCATRFPQNETKLIIRHSAIRPADTSAFINEYYNPGGVDYFFNLGDGQKIELLGEMKNTAVGIVHETTVWDLFRHKYEQIAMGQPARHNIIPNMNVESVNATDDYVDVTAVSKITGEKTTWRFDILFVGSGYERRTQVTLLEKEFGDQLFPMMIRRDYSLVAHDTNKFQPAVYLQGQSEGSHGVNDAALSVMSLRGYEVVESVLRRKAGHQWDPNEKANIVRIGGDREDGLIWGF